MKIQMFFLLLLYFNSSFCQEKKRIKINDSTYMILFEDTSSKIIKLNAHRIYNLDISFNGFFYKDSVTIIQNNKKLFSDTVTTWNKNPDSIDTYLPKSDLSIILKGKPKNNLIFTFNKLEIIIPLIYGYRMLYVDLGPDLINDKQVRSYRFYFSNHLRYRL